MVNRLIFFAMAALCLRTAYADVDSCSNINSMGARHGSCDHRPVCYDCFQVDGCSFDMNSGKCKAVFNATSDEDFCTKDDESCKSCDADSDGECRGLNGCLCPVVCEHVTKLDEECASNGDSFPAFAVDIVAVIAGVIVGIALITFHCIRKRGRQSRLHQQSQTQQVHVATTQSRPWYHTGLGLNGWRNNPSKDVGDTMELCGYYLKMPEYAPQTQAYETSTSQQSSLQVVVERPQEDLAPLREHRTLGDQ